MTVLARSGSRWLVTDGRDPMAPARVYDAREGAFIETPRPQSAASILKFGGWKPVLDDELLPDALRPLWVQPPQTKAAPRTEQEARPQPELKRVKARETAEQRIVRAEARMADVLERFYARQRDVVIARLRGKQARKGTRHWTYSDPRDQRPTELKAVDVDRVLDPARWRTEIEADAEEIVLTIFEGAMTDTAEDLGAQGLDLSLEQPDLQDAIRERIARIMSSTEARAEQVRRVIMDLDSTDADLEEIVEQVRGTYDQRRVWAETTARTETTGAVNGGSFEAAKRAGVTHKQWLSSRDDRVRETHDEGGADGQTVPLLLPFLVGGFPLMYPGDPLGPAQEVINCRCTMLFDREVERDERRDDIAPDRQIEEGGEEPRDFDEHVAAIAEALGGLYSPVIAEDLRGVTPLAAVLPLLEHLRAHAAALRWRTLEKLEEAAGHREVVAGVAPEVLDAAQVKRLLEAMTGREATVRAALRDA